MTIKSSGPYPQKPFVELLDPVVKHGIIQCLSPVTLGTSAVVSKFFKNWMDDPKDWKQIATKLEVVRYRDEPFKTAVITRFKANAYALKIFPIFLQAEIGKIENPFILNQRIKEGVAAALNAHFEGRHGLLLAHFNNLIRETARTFDPIQTPITFNTVRMLFQHAKIMSGATKDEWLCLLRFADKSPNNPPRNIILGQHHNLLNLLMFEIRKTTLPKNDKDHLMVYALGDLYKLVKSGLNKKRVIESCTKVAFEMGLSPSIRLESIRQQYTDPKWNIEDWPELLVHLQHAPSHLKEQTISHFKDVNFLLKAIEQACKSLIETTYKKDEIKHMIDRYVNIHQFIASIEEKPYVPDPEDRKKRIAKIRKIINDVIHSKEEQHAKYSQIMSAEIEKAKKEDTFSILRSLIPTE